MASAVTATHAKPDVILTLTHEEARTLLRITGMVRGSSGHTYWSRRTHTDAIGDALDGLVPDPGYDIATGGITFPDEPHPETA